MIPAGTTQSLLLVLAVIASFFASSCTSPVVAGVHHFDGAMAGCASDGLLLVVEASRSALAGRLSLRDTPERGALRCTPCPSVIP
jgi:hypothetical protein